jgi:hypothetical protein
MASMASCSSARLFPRPGPQHHDQTRDTTQNFQVFLLIALSAENAGSAEYSITDKGNGSTRSRTLRLSLRIVDEAMKRSYAWKIRATAECRGYRDVSLACRHISACWPQRRRQDHAMKLLGFLGSGEIWARPWAKAQPPIGWPGATAWCGPDAVR